MPKRNLTEINRLAIVVNAIENDCHICPQGAYKMTPRHELRRAEAFKGLTETEAVHLNQYQHFRNVQDPHKKALLELSDAPFHADFLDNIAKDSPSGCWALQLDECGHTALIRSLSWPGF